MSIHTLKRPRVMPTSQINGTPRLFAFETGLGWIGIAHVDQIITRVQFGFESQEILIEQFDPPLEYCQQVNDFERFLKDRFLRYAAGENVEFEDLEIDDSWMTPFQRVVTSTCRSIAYGETLTYGELAETSGSANAARAVGTVMSKNRFPLIVPCHRVVSGGGRIGGFSAPRGTSLKLQLLNLEGASQFDDPI